MAIGKYNVAHKLKKRQLLIAVNCVAGLSISSLGMMAGVNNSKDYIDRMKYGYVDEHGTPIVTNSLLIGGGIVAIYYFGTLLGCLLGGVVGDRIGRLIPSIAFGCAWAIVGASLQCSAMNVAWVCCARLVNLNCIEIGILNAIVPVWAAETVEYKPRGQFMAIEFTLNIFGVVVAYWLEYGLSYIDDGASAFRWRFPIAFQIIPLIILLSAVWFFPESPHYLIKAGRHDDARYILQRLCGPEEAEVEHKDICNIVELEKKHASRNSYLHMSSSAGSGNLHLGRRVQLVIWLEIM
ncbi:hypothetical protein L873DRAFT_1828307 [Choiromyces venosus 120613-1]|uniref:Major facilitator superfamily (MFS) profile domain-containing protein n=1 Tax=Choiromyces venosus 120613-1 TaxID=1336337 RepID=A0A3N4JYW1_9PEZI|nr:hypothetical protein L873DRAFT_1828307 [Choiromyces venosus 120613-1]